MRRLCERPEILDYLSLFAKTVFLMCLLLTTTISFAEKPRVLHINAQDKTFSLTLPANPTTGYQWTIKQYDKALLTLTDSRYVAPNTKRLGAGGQMLFTFSYDLNTPTTQSTTLVFEYKRAWEKAPVTLETIQVYFDGNLNGK
jgi:inhibitor of cysteine peptidase